MTGDRQLEICVCTYRRPQVSKTLASLFALTPPPGFAVSVLVIDNDDTPSARIGVEAMAESAPFPLRHVHCPQGNISIARNGALSHSAARYLAFIDDDEIASPEWLIHLVGAMEQEDVDVVLGPVEAVYSRTAPAWMRRTEIHSTTPVWIEGVIPTGYTGNVLIDRQGAALQNRVFDLELGQTGGEDSTFFAGVVADGGRIAFASEAVVREDVPEDRATLGWLLRRRFRMGQTHVRSISGTRRAVRQMPVTAAKALYCAGAAAVQVFSVDRRNQAILRGALHIGALAGLAGGRPLRQYAPQFTSRTHE